MVDHGKKVVYFEKQGNDMLCGLHTVNAILQGPYFDEVSLSQVAQKIDNAERLLLGDSPMMSHNVGMDGNYSIQVLTQAIQELG